MSLMKSVVIAIALVLITALCSLNARAARAYGQSVIYFAADGTVVGQQLAYCNNVSYHGGNITSPYRLEIWTGCGGANYTCAPDPYGAGGYACSNQGINTATFPFDETNLPSGMTFQDACDVTQGSCQFNPSPLLGSYGFTLSSGWQ